MTETALLILASTGAALALAAILIRRRDSRSSPVLSLEELAIRSARMGAWVWKPDQKALEVSDGWLAMLGLAREEFNGDLQDWLQRVHPTYRPAMHDAVQDVIAGKSSVFECEFRIQAAGRGYTWVMARGRLDPASKGRPRRLVGVQVDITSVVDVERRVLGDSSHDLLTGLPNRPAFAGILEAACLSAADERFALLFLDLNRFKAINDSLGHGVGDAVLAAVAVRLERNRRPGDSVARVGGDEFVVLLRRVSGEQQCLGIARRLHQLLTAPYQVGAHTLNAGASIGVTLSGTPSGGAPLSPDQVMRDADQAMYRAKSRGEGVVLFNQEMKDRAVRSGVLQSELDEAARKGLFELHYQPVLSLADGRVDAVEALLRWNRGGRERLAAGEFIGLAKESGLITELDRTAIRMACSQRAEWLAAGLPDFRVAVNVAGGHLVRPGFPDEIERLIEEADLDPKLLEIEAGEQALVESLQADPGILNALDELGVGISIDDYGLGDGSLRYLERIPARALKLDRAFVLGARRSERSSKALRGLIGFAHEIGMLVIAEGIEASEDADWLEGLGCDLAQGYFFARPMAAKRLTPMLLKGCFDRLEPKQSAQSMRALSARLTGGGQTERVSKPH